jgi:glutaminyl-peptide cyclotransferase
VEFRYKGLILGLVLIILSAGSCTTLPASELSPGRTSPTGTTPAIETSTRPVYPPETVPASGSPPARISPAASVPVVENSPVPLSPEPVIPEETVPGTVPVYTYRIIHAYPHDTAAFTQGLLFDSGFLYEGTGNRGKSSVRKVELETGKVLQIQKLPDEYFGEGITLNGETIVQLTWLSNTGLVFDKKSFSLLRKFSYTGEGWGITNDGARLIMSNGSSTLTFLDRETLSPAGSIEIQDGDTPIDELNELEYINGKILANVYRTEKIVIINPANGRVTGWIDLTGLLQTRTYSGQVSVLNGIAHDAQTGRLFVTGKYWPFLFEIKLEPKN